MRDRGFTLIELMVVLVIIGVVTSLVVITVGGDSPAEAAGDEVRRAAALLDLAQEQAILEGREYGVELNRDGYRFYRFQDADWRAIEDDRLFRPRQLERGLVLTLRVEGEPVALARQAEPRSAPQLVLYSSGERTPFELTVAAEDERVAGPGLLGTAFGQLQIAWPDRT